MDVLPAQTSAVPCERVFSSSKETCSLRICQEVLEALQVLKFSYKKNCLNFVNDLMAREKDYTISGQITEAAFDELYKAGRMEELRELIQNSKDIDTDTE
jgi:predicted S18 family serine protease